MRNLILTAGAAIAYVAGGVCMKYSNGLRKVWPSVFIFVLFCIGAALQALAIRQAPLGTSYVFILGLEGVLAFALGSLIFSEPVDLSRIAAVVLIVLGIILLKSG